MTDSAAAVINYVGLNLMGFAQNWLTSFYFTLLGLMFHEWVWPRVVFVSNDEGRYSNIGQSLLNRKNSPARKIKIEK